MSPRRPASFVRINCTAISEPLLEAELFGNDAMSKPGMLEAADGGTAFLSDIDQLPRDAPAEAAARRRGCLGSPHRSAPSRARSTSASSRRPRRTCRPRSRRTGSAAISYFRLAGATFTLPPLRDRKDEVIPLAEQFIASAAGPIGRSFRSPRTRASGSRATTGRATSASCATRASARCCSRPAR